MNSKKARQIPESTEDSEAFAHRINEQMGERSRTRTGKLLDEWAEGRRRLSAAGKLPSASVKALEAIHCWTWELNRKK